MNQETFIEMLRSNKHSVAIELTVLAAFAIFSLRVVNWFEYPYILVSGDFRPPLVYEAFIKRVFYTWDEIDFGIPSVYSPRILDPFYFFTAFFQTLGVSLYHSQIIAVYLMYFLSSTLMYILVKTITNGNTITSIIAAFFLTSNIFLLNDREVTAIGFIGTTLMMLPCLVSFAKSIKTHSYRLMAVSGILCVLTYATFPNYRTTLLSLMALFLLLIHFCIGRNVQISFHKRITIKFTASIKSIKLIATFALALFLASTFVMAIASTNLDVLASAYEKLSTPWFIGGRELHFVMRLIARWGFDSGAMGVPYIPYRDAYLNNPLMIFLSFLPAIIAFNGILLSEERRTTIFFGVVAVISLALTSGLSFVKYGERIYFDLMGLPMLKAFREASNWIFFTIFSFGVLMGCTVSAVCNRFKKGMFKAVTVALAVALFSVTTYPLITGEVASNWLNPKIKGSNLPNSYLELNNMLPENHWSILLPGRDIYVIYNFSGVPFNCGNPYPLIFSKPIISGTGTEYIQSQSLDLINKIYQETTGDINYRNIALEGNASASSSESDEFTPDKAVDGQKNTRWSSKLGYPQWFLIEWTNAQEISKIRFIFESAFPKDYTIQFWNGSSWETIIKIENNNSTRNEILPPQPLYAAKLRILFTEVSHFGNVSIWELEVYTKTTGLSRFLGILGIKYLILEKNIILGSRTSADEIGIRGSEQFKPVKEWSEIELYENTYGLQQIYMADNILDYSTINDIYKTTESLEWNTLNHSAFVEASYKAKLQSETMSPPKNLTWRKESPTLYEVQVKSEAPFILVFLQNYDRNWRVYVNSHQIPDENHLKVNAFANGWLIEETGNLKIKIEYETQKLIRASAILSIILPALLIILLSRKDLTSFYLKFLRTAKTKTGSLKNLFRGSRKWGLGSSEEANNRTANYSRFPQM
jgi:hypothetical protein